MNVHQPMSIEAELAALKAENARLRDKVESAGNRSITFKVSVKGAMSAYGLGRWPVTLYKTQWTRLLDAQEDIREFLKRNDALLASKADKE